MVHWPWCSVVLQGCIRKQGNSRGRAGIRLRHDDPNHWCGQVLSTPGGGTHALPEANSATDGAMWYTCLWGAHWTNYFEFSVRSQLEAPASGLSPVVQIHRAPTTIRRFLGSKHINGTGGKAREENPGNSRACRVGN